MADPKFGWPKIIEITSESDFMCPKKKVIFFKSLVLIHPNICVPSDFYIQSCFMCIMLNKVWFCTTPPPPHPIWENLTLNQRNHMRIRFLDLENSSKWVLFINIPILVCLNYEPHQSPTISNKPIFHGFGSLGIEFWCHLNYFRSGYPLRALK